MAEGVPEGLKELDRKLDAIGQNKQIIRELMFKKGRTSEENVYSFAAIKIKGTERSKAPNLYGDPKAINASVNRIAPAIANTIIAEDGANINPETQYQPRDEQISVRELLANVIEDASTSADEMAWLKGYRKDLNELDKKLDAIGQNKQIIRELMFKKGRTSEESQRLSKARGQLIVSGHSRKYFGQAFEGRFWLNHGNLGKRRFAQKTSFALLRIDGGTWNVEKIVPKQQRKKHRWTAPG